MLPDATTLRIDVYQHLLAHGSAPTSAELGRRYQVDAAEVRRALASLRIGKTLLPHPDSGEIWMAGPFSAVPTPYRVIGARATWFANCAWDMLGVAVIANEAVRIETRCTDCDAPMLFDVNPKVDFLVLEEPHQANDPNYSMGAAYLRLSAVVHFLVPARRWYDDIGFT